MTWTVTNMSKSCTKTVASSVCVDRPIRRDHSRDNSILLITCRDAPEPTIIVLSSGLTVEVGATSYSIPGVEDVASFSG